MDKRMTLRLPTGPAWEMAKYPPRESVYRFESGGQPVWQINVERGKILREDCTLTLPTASTPDLRW